MVLIRYNLTVLQNKSVSAGQNQCAFSSLTPGRLYTVTVETWSGGYVSSTSTDGRTCESELVGRTPPPLFPADGGFSPPPPVPAAVRNLSLSSAGTSDLTLTWSPAPGDVDHYEVRVWGRQRRADTVGGGPGSYVGSRLAAR